MAIDYYERPYQVQGDLMMPVATWQAADEETLHQCLEGILARRFGAPPVIRRIEHKKSECPGWYGSEIVTVELDEGGSLKIFLKDFSTSRGQKDGMVQRRERELEVYRDLLADADLGTARYYGSVWDESEGRFWLLLELVKGTQVRYCEFEYWVRAAAWLGRLQGHFARCPERLRACEFLLRHDAAFFWSRADQAVRAVSQLSAPLTRRLEILVRGYGPLVDVMASQPTTFVHGSYTATQILVSGDAEPPRVCPVDWELAGIGSALYDFAFFSEGFEPARLNSLWSAYQSELQKSDVRVLEGEEMRKVVSCIRLHRIMNWLSKSFDKGYPVAKVDRLVDMAERLSHG